MAVQRNTVAGFRQAIGEVIKDEAPGLFKGERVGTWHEGTPRFAIAIDPIEGTTNVAKGMPNSLSCIAAALVTEGQPCLLDVPAFYMHKFVYPLGAGTPTARRRRAGPAPQPLRQRDEPLSHWHWRNHVRDRHDVRPSAPCACRCRTDV